ncbi:hypothetical protein L7F22_048129 [Adiantum nelumboides]|nr:hypothetical protein [Adiantum nelumboides]
MPPLQLKKLWSNVMKLAKKGEFTKEVLHEAGDCIHLEKGWNDPVDSMLVHTYITHCKNHEAVVEGKPRRENGDEGSSKRAIRNGRRNDAAPPRAPLAIEEVPSPKVTMEVSTLGKKKETTKGKQKGPAYKLQSSIELATNLKKVLEKRSLNSKAEFTLREVLGIIAKYEFHEEIIDIIKRKRQMLGEDIFPPEAEEYLSKTQGIQLQAKETNVALVGWYQSFGKVKQVQFANDDEHIKAFLGATILGLIELELLHKLWLKLVTLKSRLFP